MPPTLVNEYVNTASPPPVVVNITTPPIPGNLLVFNTTHRSVGQTAGAIAGWTLSPLGTTNRIATYYRIADGSETSVTSNWTGSNEIRGHVSEWSGIASGTPVETDDNTGVDTTNCLAGTVSPTGEVLILSFIAYDEGGDAWSGSNPPVWGAGAAELVFNIDNGANRPAQCGGFQVVDGDGSPITHTLNVGGSANGDEQYDAQTLVFAASAAPQPPVDPPFVCALDDVDLSELVCISADQLVDWKIRAELQGTGSGYIVIHRSNDFADTDTIKKGNWVAVTIPQIDDEAVFVFQVETVETVVIDREEGGGETVKVAGRGNLSYLERPKAWNESFVVPAGKSTNGGILHGPAATGNKAGQILRRSIDEWQHEDRGVGDFGYRLEPIKHVTTDFDYDDDSSGDPWNTTAMTDELSQGYVGEAGLNGIMELIGTGEIDILMWPNFLLQGFNAYGRDLSGVAFGPGVVRFARGVNIAERLVRQEGLTVDPTHTLVQGQQNAYGYAESPVFGSQAHVEGFVKSFGTDPDALEAIGVADMARRIRQSESVQFRVTCPRAGHDPDENAGLYLPGPEGTNGQYWLGDTVTLHTGSAFRDYANVDARIMAITITTDAAGDLEVTVELSATTFTGRLRPTTGTPGGTSSSPSAGNTGGGSPAPPPPGAQIDGHLTDPTDAHDASAVSVVPFGSIAATNVQDALEEIVAEAGSNSGSGGFDVTPPQSVPIPPWVKPTGTGVITADPQGRISIDTGSGYKAFPGMAFLEGRLHLVYRDGSAHNSSGGVVKYRTSDDLGRTWSAATTIYTPPGSDDYRDPYLTALSSGRLLISFTRATTGGTVPVEALVGYSDNRGRTWSSLTAVTTSFTGEVVTSVPAVELPGGTILQPGYGDNSGDPRYTSVVWTSTDGGVTFGSQVTIATSGSLSFNETRICHLASGRLVALIREETTGDTYRSVSTDAGATWSAAAMVIDNSVGGRPDFVEFFPNALLWFGRGTSFASRWAVSWDEGATWTALQETDSGEVLDSEYHAPVVLAPGFVVIVYSIENSGGDADLYLRYYFDGYGIDPLGQLRAAGLFLNGVEFDDTDPDDGEVWTYDSGTGKYVLATPAGGSNVPPAILLESGHAVPFTFDEILQESDGSDFLWASE